MNKSTLKLGPPLPKIASAKVETQQKNPAKHSNPINGEADYAPEEISVDGSHGSVSLKLGVTVGLPDYCGVRVDVGVECPLDADDNVDKVFAQAKEWATKKLQEEVNALIEGMNSD